MAAGGSASAAQTPANADRENQSIKEKRRIGSVGSQPYPAAL
jgi:hypothetical protein